MWLRHDTALSANNPGKAHNSNAWVRLFQNNNFFKNRYIYIIMGGAFVKRQNRKKLAYILPINT